MNTQTHILVCAALLTRPDAPRRNAAVLAGALVPDLSIYTMYAIAKAQGVSEHVIWGELHFSSFWQDWAAATNSIPIYAALLILAAAWAWPVLSVFGLSALAHIALDFPVHNADAHRHFWPISDWRFESPLSYWHPAHYGDWVARFELALGLVVAVVLWRRFGAPWARAVIALALVPYMAMPLYWMGVFG